MPKANFKHLYKPATWGEIAAMATRQIEAGERRLERLRKMREMAREKAALGEPIPVKRIIGQEG
jgi:hypothetical protein